MSKSTYTDQLGRFLSLDKPPARIVSLVPSQTEFLADLGLENELIGITKFCVHPKSVYQNTTRVGGTKDFNIEKIKDLAPELIVCNKEENERQKVEELARFFPVYISDISNLGDAYEMMGNLGDICGKKEKALQLIEDCKLGFNELSEQIQIKKKLRTIYLIWNKPYMAAGSNNFIDHMLERAGFINMFKHHPLRYPAISESELLDLSPEVLLLSSEPYPFKDRHIKELKNILPLSKIMLVDGELFSWYGSRLTKTADYLKKLRSNL